MLHLTMMARMKLCFLSVVYFGSLSCAESRGQRGSLDSIRIQSTTGEPWPKPQSIQTTGERFALHPDTFQFRINDTSQRCDLLTGAFARYYRAIFFPQTYLSHLLGTSSSSEDEAVLRKTMLNLGSSPLLKDFYVNVQEPCNQWPTLESNESCNRIVSLLP